MSGLDWEWDWGRLQVGWCWDWKYLRLGRTWWNIGPLWWRYYS